MVELQKVKRDVINYGALKVYTTFLTLSEDEVDPELFAASQLKEIFEKRFDVIKVDMSFVEGEEETVIAKELLVFKLSKCSDSEISYMSNVDDEGKLSSLVLTKSGEEISLEVVEYGIGESSKGLEVIEWDGERTFAEEEIDKLSNAKACLKYDENIYIPNFEVIDVNGKNVYLHSINVSDDGMVYCKSIQIIATGEGYVPNISECNINTNNLGGTKLYKHTLNLGGSKEIEFISNTSLEILNFNQLLNAIRIDFRVSAYPVVGSCCSYIYNMTTHEATCVVISPTDGSTSIYTLPTIISDTVTEL